MYVILTESMVIVECALIKRYIIWNYIETRTIKQEKGQRLREFTVAINTINILIMEIFIKI